MIINKRDILIKDTGLNLKKLRLSKNLSVKYIAIELGIEYQRYIKYEKGFTLIPVLLAMKLCEFYEVTLNEIYNKELKN